MKLAQIVSDHTSISDIELTRYNKFQDEPSKEKLLKIEQDFYKLQEI